MSSTLTATGPHLTLDGIDRRFGAVTALEGVSLDVARGEIVCLAGQSGCGKSTLLRVIAGIETPDRGRVVLDGREVSGPQRHVEPEDRNIGFMFQDYALFPHLNVTDNILFGLRRINKAAARQRCAEITQRLNLGPLASRFPHMLSGGEQQRVALARALAPHPPLLLMDEPFSNLDRRLRDDVRSETMALLRELGATVIMVTHDPEEALSTGDRVVLMRAGRIVQAGTGREIYDQPNSAYVAEFFCTFNKVPGACWGGFLETPLGRFAAPGLADGDRGTAYIRPQCLRLDCGGGGVGDGADCTVTDCSLMGEIEQICLAHGNLPQPLRLRSTERQRLSAGDKVRVSVEGGKVFVF